MEILYLFFNLIKIVGVVDINIHLTSFFIIKKIIS